MIEMTFIGIAVLVGVAVFAAVFFRTVVPTNEVHIIQSAKSTTSYGKDQEAGNVYYRWPSWIPKIGIQTSILPLSVFDLMLNSYDAYDKGRVPFTVDIMAFFRVSNSNLAAQRVHSVGELKSQLNGILQSAARAILSTSEIEQILEGRTEFGKRFTEEVDKELAEWGIQTVKNIEFMDIRDASGSKVIHNIMAKKQSLIEMQSRVEVANNQRTAKEKEIEAAQAVEIRQQEAFQTVGERTALKDQAVGIAQEKAQQEIREQARVTAEKDMAVKQVNDVRTAEITKQVQVVAAEQQKQTDVVRAEGEKQKTVLVAEGALSAKKLEAEGIQAEGTARAEAEKAMQLAPVQAQITLAKEIGSNEGYQGYLVRVREIEALQIVGIEQAQALKAADVKVIANTGAPVDGVKSVMDLFTAKGGTQLGAMLEALKQTDAGKQVVAAVSGGASDRRSPNGDARK